MKCNIKIWTIILLGILTSIILDSCANSSAKTKSETATQTQVEKIYASDIIDYIKECKILLGNGERSEDLINYEQSDFFYTANDGEDWVVFKAPNAGTTSPNSSNTRSELHHTKEWIPETGGKLTGQCKVMHVSTTGDARVAASYSVVVGQIHSSEGHENEPLKIFYKKFPGHEKGSLFWNYEINTQGENNKRWDYSYPIWGYDMTVVGSSPSTYPTEPIDGIALGEEFGYEVNVYKGVMHLTFTREGHDPKTFTKNLLASDFANKEDIPEQIKTTWFPIGRDGTERPEAYAGELQYFKQGSYNQTNGKKAESNILWSTESETYGGDISKQYANGSYAEVWFKEGSAGPGTPVE